MPLGGGWAPTGPQRDRGTFEQELLEWVPVSMNSVGPLCSCA